jgi:hypothetical protein
MGQELQIPAIFQNTGMAKAFQGKVNPHDDNLADGIGQSYPVIAYKGKIWALRHRGERKIVIRPDDGSPSGHLDVVILAQAKSKSKSYYKKFDPGTSEGDRPICASIDGVVPDSDVTQKQSDTCALCQRNVWKTDPQTGRKGRDCTDYKRLAVLVAPNQSSAALGSPLVEPMFLRVPPDSLNSLAIMGDTMTRQGFHYSTYWTRISFDPVKAHPCMVFRPLQPVKEDEAPVILELRDSPTVMRIIGGDVSQQGSMREVEQEGPSLTAPVTRPEPVAAEPAPVLPLKKPRGRPPAAAPQQLDLLTQEVEQPPTPVPHPVGGNGLYAERRADAGIAGVPDEGQSEASDDELDAEIAKLIAK